MQDAFTSAQTGLWPLFPFAALVIIGRITYYEWRRSRLAAAGIPAADRMSGTQFEQRLGALFRERGYQVEFTPTVGDYGADLILTRNGERIAVQAKRRSRCRVGNDAVQQALGGQTYYKCARAMVITNGRFTDQAEMQARAANVELWDRDRLAKELSAQKRRTESEAARPNEESPRDRISSEPPQTQTAQLTSGRLLTEPIPDEPPVAELGKDVRPQSAAACRTCASGDLALLPGRYGYYFKCRGCGGNTPVRLTCSSCGAKERISRNGSEFEATCDVCRTTRHFCSNR